MKIVQVNIAATELLLFTPLPQIHMKNVLLDNKIISKDEIVTLEYINSESLSKIFFEIAEFKPSIVTFSVYVWNYKAVVQLSESLKNKFGKDCFIVWGGPHVSEDPLVFLRKNFEFVDFLVTWYGERPIMDITKAYKDSNADLNSAKEKLIEKRAKGIYFYGNFNKNRFPRNFFNSASSFGINMFIHDIRKISIFIAVWVGTIGNTSKGIFLIHRFFTI